MRSSRRSSASAPPPPGREAGYWRKIDAEQVQCLLCPHFCTLKPGQVGICRNRKNLAGTLYAHRWGEISALSLDPMEKKPLYHFFPGRMILSVGTIGCNLGCVFCQNYHLVTDAVPTEVVSPEDLLRATRREDTVGLSYTYNEPYISYEFVLETAQLIRAAGYKNVLVTNGFYNPEPFEALLPYVDAMNIDLKSIRDEFYQKYSKARLAPVQKTIERAHQSCLVEVTNLLVTGLNDSDEDIRDLVDYLAAVNRDIPLHFSRYHPMYQLDRPATPEERLRRAYEIAKEKMTYVYLGNVQLEIGQDTDCPHCGAKLVRRRGYAVTIENLHGSKCGACGRKVHFVS